MGRHSEFILESYILIINDDENLKQTCWQFQNSNFKTN